MRTTVLRLEGDMVDTKSVNMADVMTKIGQIRELASRAGTQAEAEAAAGKMASLLLRFNLSLGDIDAHVRQTNRRVVNEKFQTSSASWKVSLLTVVARAHLCKTVYTGNGATVVIGHEHNLIVVRETWEWLSAVAEESMKISRRVAERLGDRRAESSPTKWGNDFKIGFVDGISITYKKMRSEVKAETTTQQWAIVPVLEHEVAVEFSRLYPRTSTRTTHFRESDAYGYGTAAGASVNLGSQLGSSRSNKQIGE